MSLINDALKRAKQAHQESSTPVAPVPQLKPVEPVPHDARRAAGLLLPLALGTIALLGLLLLWVLWKRQGSPQALAGTDSITAAARTPAHADTSIEPESQKSPVTPSSSPAGTTAPANPPTNVPALAALTENGPSNTNASGSSETETNHAMVLSPASPRPTPLKLQSIVFNPKTPSAMINGRVVFVGDRIRDERITAIHRDEVVLTGAGRTNVLSLEP